MLARKLTFVLAAIVFLAAGVLGATWSEQLLSTYREAKRARLETLAEATRIAVENMLRTGSLEDLRRMVSRLEESEEILGVIIVNADKRPMIKPNSAVSEHVWQALQSEQPVAGVVLPKLQHRARVLPLTGSDGGEIGRLAVVQDWSDLDATRRQALARSALLAGTLALITGLFLLVAVHIVVAAPLARVQEAVRRIAAGGISEQSRVTLRQRDEIGELARAFNDMQGELERAQGELLAAYESRLAIEQSMHASERLAAAGQLAAGVAHEIGTALNVIQGRAQLLMEKNQAVGDDSPDLEIMVKQCERISSTVRSMLDFARGREPKRERLELGDLARSVLELCAPRLTRVEVTLHADPDPVLVDADRGMIEDLMVNLVINAVQAMGDAGGRLTVTTARAADGDGAAAVVRVADTGPGIEPDKLDRIFEPFFSTKASGAGTGLGLSISHKIATDHGGRIEVRSKPGAGACFSVYLPVSAERRTEAA